MTSRIIETLESLEERIENIKWMIAAAFSGNRTSASINISSIRKSAGLLGKSFPKGTAFENRARKDWKANFAKRIG